MRYDLDFTDPLVYWPDLLAGAATTLGLTVAATVPAHICALIKSPAASVHVRRSTDHAWLSHIDV